MANGVEGSASAVLAATPGKTPTKVLATAAGTSVTLSWTPVIGATGYNVYYAAGTGATTSSSKVPAGDINGMSAVIPGLNVGTEYAFVVTYVNGIESAASQVAVAYINATVLADFSSSSIGTMKAIQGGTFQRDSTASDLSSVSSFQMSQCEITGAQYAAVMGLADPSAVQGTNMPVTEVSWYGALVFCNNLSLKEGRIPVYSIGGSVNPSAWGVIPTGDNAIWDAVSVNAAADGYRLPTEMEYMWAMMGGLSDSRAGDLSGGVNLAGYQKGYAGSSEPSGGTTNLSSYVYADSSYSQPTTVGSKLPNELGIFDLSGNVNELCFDWYASWPTGAKSDYSGPGSGSLRTWKGSYYGDPYSAGVSNRSYHENPGYKAQSLGFRVVTSFIDSTRGTIAISWSIGPYQAVSFDPSSTTISSGNALYVTPSITGGTNYQWYVNGSPAGSGSTLSYSPPAPGFYTIYLVFQYQGQLYSGSANATVTQ